MSGRGDQEDDWSRRLVIYNRRMETINASEFKAKCLAILDRVKETGQEVLILKRGRPVAQLVPPRDLSGSYPQKTLKGTVKIVGNIVEPAIPEGDWESNHR